MPSYQTDVNGVRTSYCSIAFGLDGIRLRGIRSINYRNPTEIGTVMSNGVPGPFGRTRGNAKPEGDMEILQAEFTKVVLPLVTLSGVFGYSELSFPISVAYSELLSPADTVQDDLIGVRLHSPEIANSDGTEAAFYKVTFSMMRLRLDGKYVAFRER